MGITIDLCYVTLYDITPSLYLETLGNICARFESPSLLHISLPYITSFDTKRIHPRNQITCSHTSCCHHCSIHFVLFHNITCYTYPLLSRIHVNITYFLNITCIMVSASMILGRLECSSPIGHKDKARIENKLGPDFQ